MASADARDRLVALRADAGAVEARLDGGQVVDHEPGMRLAGRGERLLDSDVELLRPRPEPAAAAPRERLGLRQLLEPEQPGVERPRLRLAAARGRHLHVVDADDAHRQRFTIGRVTSVQPPLEDTLVSGYTRLASEAPHRLVDLELRILDVVFAALFLILLTPLAAVIALLVLATSGRPVLYRGERVGRRGRFFEMLKFRTLQTGAEDRIGQYLGEE